MTIELINKSQRNFRNHSQGSRDIGLATVLNMLKELNQTMAKNEKITQENNAVPKTKY